MEHLEQTKYLDLHNFTSSLRIPNILKELGPEANKFRFDISEVVSNLDRMFSMGFTSHEEMEVALDDALSGEKKSLTPIKLPPEIRDNFKNLLMVKINEQIDK